VSVSPAQLFLVATPIGNLEDVTHRALRVLAEVDIVAAEDTRHTRRLLERYGVAARLVSLFEHNERARVSKLLAELKAGRSVAVVTDAGSPAVSDPGYPLVRAAAPHDPHDLISLQAGARTFVNYCLGCHGLESMRYGKLTDLGLTEAQIKDYLMFTADKVGEPIRTVMPRKESKSWFGVAPPDLSLAARARSADWLYTYLRTFYRDAKTVTGWNNAVFENVAMPHALWTLQGERAYDRESGKWTEIAKGIQSPADMTPRCATSSISWCTSASPPLPAAR